MRPLPQSRSTMRKKTSSASYDSKEGADSHAAGSAVDGTGDEEEEEEDDDDDNDDVDSDAEGNGKKKEGGGKGGEGGGGYLDEKNTDNKSQESQR